MALEPFVMLIKKLLGFNDIRTFCNSTKILIKAFPLHFIGRHYSVKCTEQPARTRGTECNGFYFAYCKISCTCAWEKPSELTLTILTGKNLCFTELSTKLH